MILYCLYYKYYTRIRRETKFRFWAGEKSVSRKKRRSKIRTMYNCCNCMYECVVIIDDRLMSLDHGLFDISGTFGVISISSKLPG